jgi:hypothetical protein
MARRPKSELEELLKLLRRILVLAVAAYGLARGMPFPVLAVRLAILWAVLYVGSGLMDVVYRRLHYHSTTKPAEGPESAAKSEAATVSTSLVSNKP